MTLRIERISGKRRTRIRLSGELRCDDLDQVKTEIERSGPRVVLDLEEVDHVDVEGRALSQRVSRGGSLSAALFALCQRVDVPRTSGSKKVSRRLVQGRARWNQPKSEGESQ